MTEYFDALNELTELGYEFEVEGNILKIRNPSLGVFPSDVVNPFMKIIQDYEEEVKDFLRIYCSRCTGIAYGTYPGGRKYCRGCYFATFNEHFSGDFWKIMKKNIWKMVHENIVTAPDENGKRK